ncbi:integrase, partial [Calditrichota bacterium]
VPMSNTSRSEYLLSIKHRYLNASKIEKNKILDEFCSICGYNRKYAIRLLNQKSPPKNDW